ncbi:MAG: hypothetical protein ACQERZ_02730 [Fusobacteriota bacterium]
MNSQLKKAIINHQKSEVKDYYNELKDDDDFSLELLIEDLLPLMVMECNLRYGSFHFVKMSLYLRELSQKNYFDKESELEIAKVIIFGLSERHFVYIESDSVGYKEEGITEKTYEKLAEEINNGNSHNAFYYALGILKNEPDKLKEYLISLGMERINDSLGHSISCFFPVMRDIANHHKDVSATSVLSYVMYLCRYSYTGKYNNQVVKKIEYEELENLGLKAVSGDGIVNLHHMITYYTFLMLEDSSFYEKIPPYTILENFFDGKQIDNQRLELVKVDKNAKISEDYQQFKDGFSLKNYKTNLPFLFKNLDDNYKKTVSYLHRLFAKYYNPSWDPHYYTGLYCALGLYNTDKIQDKNVKKMAIIQAVEYFTDNIL